MMFLAFLLLGVNASSITYTYNVEIYSDDTCSTSLAGDNMCAAVGCPTGADACPLDTTGNQQCTCEDSAQCGYEETYTASSEMDFLSICLGMQMLAPCMDAVAFYMQAQVPECANLTAEQIEMMNAMASMMGSGSGDGPDVTMDMTLKPYTDDTCGTESTQMCGMFTCANVQTQFCDALQDSAEGEMGACDCVDASGCGIELTVVVPEMVSYGLCVAFAECTSPQDPIFTMATSTYCDNVDPAVLDLIEAEMEAEAEAEAEGEAEGEVEDEADAEVEGESEGEGEGEPETTSAPVVTPAPVATPAPVGSSASSISVLMALLVAVYASL